MLHNFASFSEHITCIMSNRSSNSPYSLILPCGVFCLVSHGSGSLLDYFYFFRSKTWHRCICCVASEKCWQGRRDCCTGFNLYIMCNVNIILGAYGGVARGAAYWNTEACGQVTYRAPTSASRMGLVEVALGVKRSSSHRVNNISATRYLYFCSVVSTISFLWLWCLARSWSCPCSWQGGACFIGVTMLLHKIHFEENSCYVVAGCS